MDSVSPEAAFETFDPSWKELRNVHEVLRTTIQEKIGRKFYAYEMRKPAEGFKPLYTIQSLSEALVEDMEIPIPKNSFYDPFEGGVLAWSQSSSHNTDKTPKNPQMAFLLTSPRSGSTLLRVMLEGRPDIFSPPELNLLSFYSMSERRKELVRLGYTHKRYGPLITLMELKGLSMEEAEKEMNLIENSDMTIKQFYRMLQSHLNDKLLIDKSPGYAIHMPWLERAETLFENTKYICLIRHPYEVIESIVRMRFSSGLIGNHSGIWDDNPWLFAEKWWAATYSNILRFREMIDSDRQILIHYEELVTQPEKTHIRLSHFLEVPFYKNVLGPYDGDRMTTIFPGDPNLKSRNQIEKSLATFGKGKRPPHTLSPFTKKIAEQFGYLLD